jgi:hypothetical protein
MLRRLSVRHLFALVPMAAVVALTARDITDNSFLWHVRAGTAQLEAGEVIRTDPFSFTAFGETWRTQSWLADLLYGWLENTTGDLSWVWPMMALVLVVAIGLTGLSVYREMPDPRTMAVVVFFVSWLALRTMVPRPVIFSHLALAMLVVALGTRKGRWTIPLVMWLWAAVHGSYIVGLGLILLEAIRSRDRSLGGWLGLSALAVSLTAHGPALWGVLASFLRNREALEVIQEWAPPDFTQFGNAPFVLIVLALLVGAARSRIGVRDLVVVLPFLIFAMSSNRAVFPAALVLAPWAARGLDGFPSRRRTEAPILNWAVAVVLLAGAVMVGLSRTATEPDPEFFPVAASEALDPGNAFLGDLAGGYLIFAQWPDRRVYIDDRAELHGIDGFEEMLEVRAGRDGWEEVLARWQMDQALLRPGETGLEEVLRLSGWQEQYADAEFVVLRRP